MSQALELRCVYCDSLWADKNDDGSFSIDLPEQFEVAPEHVLFIDNVSVCGNLPQVSLHNRNLYVVERTPRTFKYLAKEVKVGAHFTSLVQSASDLDNNLAPYTFYTILSPPPAQGTRDG